MAINVSSNHVLAQEAAKVLKAQGLPASIVLTSSANAVVPKHGSEPYDVSKAAINHLIRELAIGLGPRRARQRHRAGPLFCSCGLDDASSRRGEHAELKAEAGNWRSDSTRVCPSTRSR